ncbi:MAG: hypothetical protein ACI9CA_000438 [Natronomonas sp.]|jgi:hypothetical protein
MSNITDHPDGSEPASDTSPTAPRGDDEAIAASKREIGVAFRDWEAVETPDDFPLHGPCQDFLIGRWLTPEAAVEVLGAMVPINGFVPAVAQRTVARVAETDANPGIAIGREGTPCLYLQTDAPEAAIEAFENCADHADPEHVERTGPHTLTPDETFEVGPDSLGAARKRSLPDWPLDPHDLCPHSSEATIVEVEEMAPPDPRRNHVRVWWD